MNERVSPEGYIGPQSVRAAFTSPDSHPILLDLILLREFGAEYLTWEAETLWAEVEKTWGTTTSEVNKNRIQAVKSTKSYLERQTLEAICGVAEKGEDNDGAGVPVTPPIPPELLAQARAEAMKGWKPFSAWIKARTEQERNLLVPESDNLKAAAKAADAKGVAK